MRLLRGLLLLFLVVWVVDAQKGERRGGHRMRGRDRAIAVKRFAVNCKEYTANGDKFLDCQERYLTAVLSGWPEDINHLLLAKNRIKVLRANTFSNFPNLRSLDLQQNEISQIDENAFSGLTKLTTLLLQHNHLQVASEDMLIPMPQLRYMRIHDNPWRCDCQLDSLVRFIQVPSNRHIGNYARCAEPTAFVGRPLKKLDVEQLCTPEQKTPFPDSDNQTLPASIKQFEATTLCHTYMHPVTHLDCRSRGENDFFL